jgi:hypothetical protein
VIGESDGGGSFFINDSNGTKQVQINSKGIIASDFNDQVITANTTLDANTRNQVISVNPSGPVVITMANTADEFNDGTWIGLQDISGNASNWSISVNPNNGVSGLELDGATNTAEVITTDHGFAYVRIIKTGAATKGWFTDTTGLRSAEYNDTTVSSNTTLANSVKNEFVSVNQSASVVVNLAALANTFKKGTWIGLQDVSGNASNWNISVDPNNASSGLTLDGGTGSKVLIAKDYGTAYVRLLDDGSGALDWFSEAPSSEPLPTSAGEVNTNTTMVYPETFVAVNTAASDVQITLPDAAKYTGKPVYVKKITGDANTITIVAAVGQTIDGAANTSSNAANIGFVIVSDGGTGWWQVGIATP